MGYFLSLTALVTYSASAALAFSDRPAASGLFVLGTIIIVVAALAKD